MKTAIPVTGIVTEFVEGFNGEVKVTVVYRVNDAEYSTSFRQRMGTKYSSPIVEYLFIGFGSVALFTLTGINIYQKKKNAKGKTL